jgi:hypothetical protein
MAYLNTLHLLFHSFLSLVFHYYYNSPQQAIIDDTLNLVLRRKGIAAEVLSAQRDALMSGKHEKLKPKLQLLNELSECIGRKMLNGPDPKETLDEHQQILSKWESRRERLEKELASQISEVRLERIIGSANLRLVADALSSCNATLIEFVRMDVFDFQAVPRHYMSSWKLPRYVAFILDGQNLNTHLLMVLREPIQKIQRKYQWKSIKT